MRYPKKATAFGLAGAVAIGSVAYGLGSQAGDGSAAAGGGGGSRERGPDWDRGPGPGLDRLAEELGVDADALQDALRDFHSQERSARRGDFEAGLADALGKSTAAVEQAFDKVREAERERSAQRLAAALDVDVEKVLAAFEKVVGADREERGPGPGPGGPGDFFEELANELGVSEQELARAFRAAGPLGPRGRRGGPPHRWPSLRGLAKALDVTPAELREALGEVRAGADSRFEEHRAKLVTFLAERFDLAAEKVDEALPELGGFGPRGRGPGGPGFGGPGGPPGGWR